MGKRGGGEGVVSTALIAICGAYLVSSTLQVVVEFRGVLFFLHSLFWGVLIHNPQEPHLLEAVPSI